MTRGTDRLAAELAAQEPLRLESAVVATVDVAAATDGADLATVTWRGGAHQAAYLASYTPTVGHVVLVAVYPPANLIILGRLIGTP